MWLWILFAFYFPLLIAVNIDSLPNRKIHKGTLKSFVIPVNYTDGEFRLNITLNGKPLALRVETAEPNLWVPKRHCQTARPLNPNPCTPENSYYIKESKFMNTGDWWTRRWRQTEWKQANGERLDVMDDRDEEVGFTSLIGEKFSFLTQIHLVSYVPRSTGALGLDPDSAYLRNLLSQFQSPTFSLALTQKHGRLALGRLDSKLCNLANAIWLTLPPDSGWELTVDEIAFGKSREYRQVSLKGQHFRIGSHSDELVLPAATVDELIAEGLLHRSPDGQQLLGNSALDVLVHVGEKWVQIRGHRMNNVLHENRFLYSFRIRAQQNSSEPLTLGQPFLESNCLLAEFDGETTRMGLAQQRNIWD